MIERRATARNVGGRPKAPDPRIVSIGTKLTPPEFDTTYQFAERRGISMSEVVRLAVLAFVRRSAL